MDALQALGPAVEAHVQKPGGETAAQLQRAVRACDARARPASPWRRPLLMAFCGLRVRRLDLVKLSIGMQMRRSNTLKPGSDYFTHNLSAGRRAAEAARGVARGAGQGQGARCARATGPRPAAAPARPGASRQCWLHPGGFYCRLCS